MAAQAHEVDQALSCTPAASSNPVPPESLPRCNTTPPTMTKMGKATGTFSASTDASAAASGATLPHRALPESHRDHRAAVATLWVSSSTRDMDLFVTLRNSTLTGKTSWRWAAGSARAGGQRLAAGFAPQDRSYVQALAAVIICTASGSGSNRTRSSARWWKSGRPRWCSRQGHRLRLDVQPRDGFGSAPYTHYNGDYNSGTNTLHLGGRHDSHLLLPVIPD